MSEQAEKTVTKARVLVDTKVIVEPGYLPYWTRDSDLERHRYLKKWAEELLAFFRDHRSMDVDAVYAEPTYEIQCSGCSGVWEEMLDEDTGKTCCASCGVPIAETR